jgi:hypothetical protein
VNAPQIALAHLSADVIPEAASPLPAYRAKLDGVVMLPVRNPVTIKADKENYSPKEPIIRADQQRRATGDHSPRSEIVLHYR